MSITNRARAFCATLSLPLLFACSSSDYGGGGSAANTETISVSLTGSFEVPAVTTAGTGSGSFTIDRTTGALSGSITVTGLSGTASAAHIHNAFAGINGAIVVGLVADGAVAGKFNVPSGAVLSPADLATFLAGGMYVNAHTAANPGGEVRAQIIPTGIELARCALTGDFEVPPVTTADSGVGYATVNRTSGVVVANARTTGFADASAAHLHQAFAGLAGGIAIGMTQTGGAGTDLWETAAGATFSAAQLTGFLAGEVYVNVHTPADPGGHIRCQTVPKNFVVVRTLLDGAHEVPAVATVATGIGYATVNTTSGAATANVRTSNLVGANAAHVHQAAAGVNGGVIFGLTQPSPGTTPELWTGSGTFSAAQLTAFNADETYLNVHTGAFPDGEIRGQLVLP